VTAPRALVLGGGGVAGIAWETGVLAGLARAGLNAAVADVFVGTSAGSVVGAQLASGVSLDDLLAAQLAPPADSLERVRPYSQASVDEQNRKLMDKVGGDLAEARRRIGAFARRSETVAAEARRAIVAARLPGLRWPARALKLVAVDAESGEGRVFDATSGADFVDAVAASCAVPGAWPVVHIGGRSYMDGGIRSMTNADLAAGAARVLVLAPLGYSEGNPVSGHLHAEVDTLRSAGVEVIVVTPDASSLDAMGDNVLDPTRRPPSAQAGLLQGLALATDIRCLWAH
jgi:NTE family protein